MVTGNGATDGPRRVSILGATGSIGKSTLSVIGADPEAWVVEAVTAATKAERLAEIARTSGAKVAVVADPKAYAELKSALSGTGIEVAAGEAAVAEAAGRPADIVLAAIVGAASLAPTMAAVESGARVALANKECLVCAGSLFMETVKRSKAVVLPVDSEHNAIFQLLDGRSLDDIRQIILTASGGPFRTLTAEAMAKVTKAEALKHPNWSMGPKITIDSATLMNKGLEVIEAHYLFGVPGEAIGILVHPQSIVHGLVDFRDGSTLAAMSPPDMRTPIAHCLAWPRRSEVAAARLDLAALGSLTFEAPDPVRFPALRLAREALYAGGGATNILNAANEIAVAAFLAGGIGYLEIAEMVEQTLDRAAGMNLTQAPTTIAEALALDQQGRRIATELVSRREVV
jgi:1-deoxy-D-xylulose-5-phosphate reductoisomerase